jgi:Zn-dependent M28 family amino/carboxypeptidase
MRRLLIKQGLSAGLLLCGASVLAQTRTADDDVLRAALRAHVEFLADDLLEGRGTGSHGHAVASGYVAAQFRQLGLAPGGKSGTYQQSVPLLEATSVLPGSSARLVREGDAVNFEYSVDYLPSADFSAPTSTLTAPLAFAGFGVTAPELGYDDFANVDTQGRIVVVFGGAPAKFPANQRAYYSWNGTKYPNLIAHGAVGVILIDTPDDLERTPWERRVNASWQPQMRWLDESNKPADAYTELKQRFRFSRDAAAKLFANSSRSFDQAIASAVASEAQGFSLPGAITLATTTGLRRTESSNVIAILEGSDTKLKREYLIFTAHVDHLGRGNAVNGDAIYNGAHDNALGTALLLETARVLAAMNPRLQRSIAFVAVTAEEKGLLGSDYFVNHSPMNKAAIVANINIDMPVLLAPTRDLTALGAEHSSLGPSVARAALAQGYVLSPDNMPEEVRFIRSDQFSFIRQGIPALSVIGGYRSRVEGIDVAAMRREFLRNHYHQPSDDLSLPMDYAGAADLVRIYAHVAVEVANQPGRPRWNRKDFFASKFVVRP